MMSKQGVLSWLLLSVQMSCQQVLCSWEQCLIAEHSWRLTILDTSCQQYVSILAFAPSEAARRSARGHDFQHRMTLAVFCFWGHAAVGQDGGNQRQGMHTPAAASLADANSQKLEMMVVNASLLRCQVLQHRWPELARCLQTAERKAQG